MKIVKTKPAVNGASPEGVPFMQWCRSEARRSGVKMGTVVSRVRDGFYTGMKLLRKNARRVFVLEPGVCRKVISARERALNRPRGKALHQRDDNSHPTPGKYAAWMETYDCGGITPRHDGGM